MKKHSATSAACCLGFCRFKRWLELPGPARDRIEIAIGYFEREFYEAAASENLTDYEREDLLRRSDRAFERTKQKAAELN